MARQADLLSVDEARQRILAQFAPGKAETVPLEDSLGRALAQPLTAPRDIPPFANSSMDGFALRSAATSCATREQPVVLEVVAHVPAGSRESISIADGCARIMTGAPLPPDADAVIPFEDVEDRGAEIAISRPVGPGSCVRPMGNDVHGGQTVLEPGVEITSRQVALIAALGYGEVSVRVKPRIAILATGDELVSPGEPLRMGQIYNSNTPMLAAAVREAGGEPLTIPTAADDPDAIAAALRSVSNVDLFLTSGGASVGDFDHMTRVIASLGSVSFWKVRLRPGKPLLFGTLGSAHIAGLPGNPTSAMVTFEQFVRPVIRTMLALPPLRPTVRAVLDERIDNRGGRETYFRVRLSKAADGFHARPAGPQDSAMIWPLAHADGLLVVPEDVPELVPGDTANVQIWRLPEDAVG